MRVVRSLFGSQEWTSTPERFVASLLRLLIGHTCAKYLSYQCWCAHRQGVAWEVTVWDDQNTQCNTVSSTFEVALLDEKAWDGAQWLSRYNDPLPPDYDRCVLYNASIDRNRAPRFRTEVVLPVDIVDVRAYVVGLGYYEMFVDGARVGTSRLDPGWTSYDKTVLYAVHNLTDVLGIMAKPEPLSEEATHEAKLDASADGATHAVGIALGNGWWNPTPMLFWGRKDIRNGLVNQQGRDQGEPMFRVLIVGTYHNGTKITLTKSSTATAARRASEEGKASMTTPSQWLASGSPTTFNSIYLGEKYDARLEPAFVGWASVGFASTGWTAAVPANTTGLGGVFV